MLPCKNRKPICPEIYGQPNRCELESHVLSHCVLIILIVITLGRGEDSFCSMLLHQHKAQYFLIHFCSLTTRWLSELTRSIEAQSTFNFILLTGDHFLKGKIWSFLWLLNIHLFTHFPINSLSIKGLLRSYFPV